MVLQTGMKEGHKVSQQGRGDRKNMTLKFLKYIMLSFIILQMSCSKALIIIIENDMSENLTILNENKQITVQSGKTTKLRFSEVISQNNTLKVKILQCEYIYILPSKIIELIWKQGKNKGFIVSRFVRDNKLYIFLPSDKNIGYESLELNSDDVTEVKSKSQCKLVE